MKQLPWGLLLLFGGGLALAKAIMVSGLGDWLGAQLTFLNYDSSLLFILVLISFTVLLTEVLSNTALVISFLPIVGVLASNIGIPVNIICMIVVIAASCAFMLPISTPPNAIIYSSGLLKVKDMVKVGFVINICSIIVIWLFFYFYLNTLNMS
jgi:sodium-dependent dicarboxylate transporter 2/3/5